MANSSSVSHEDFTILQTISKSKFAVYLARHNTIQDRFYALKVFPYRADGKISSHYLRESSLSSLSHPNVVSIRANRKSRTSFRNGGLQQISYILMDYAPFGDFCDLITVRQVQFNEKLVRTFFHHMMEGLSYLHVNGVAHLDIKPENLLLGEDFQLKIADFDLSYIEGDERIYSNGTMFHRAPELKEGRCIDPYAADIFSAGVILFNFLTQGQVPQIEEKLYQGLNLLNLMNEDPESFWNMHITMGKRDAEFFKSDFKELFLGMTKLNPKDRFTLKDVKNSRWYNGDVYSNEELKEFMSKYFNK